MPDTATAVKVWVPGVPAPQGSKRHVGKGRMIESSQAVKPWRESIRWALIGLPRKQRASWPLTGAVCVWLDFTMPRPVSTPKRRTPPAIRKPDLDKLARAVLDAIGSAGTWGDDAQVVQLHCTKRLAMLGESPGLHITIEEDA